MLQSQKYCCSACCVCCFPTYFSFLFPFDQRHTGDAANLGEMRDAAGVMSDEAACAALDTLRGMILAILNCNSASEEATLTEALRAFCEKSCSSLEVFGIPRGDVLPAVSEADLKKEVCPVEYSSSTHSCTAAIHMECSCVSVTNRS